MTIGTAPLTPKATWQEIDALVAFLATLGISEVTVTYGWGCKLPADTPTVTLPLVQLAALLQNNIAQGIYTLGENNLYIGARDPVLKITLCHDADLHFDADATLEARLHSDWETRGLRVWPAAKRADRKAQKEKQKSRPETPRRKGRCKIPAA